MSKELEEIKTLRGFNKVELNNDKNINKSLDIIEQALQRLEAIDNTKPSEALEEFERIKNWIKKKDTSMFNVFSPCFSFVKQALLKAQEQEKVLKIIDEKNVDILDIRKAETVEDYNFAISYSNLNRKELTQDEFDTLRKWAKNE